MSEEIKNSNEDQIRVIVEMEEGQVTNVHANRQNVEVIFLESVTEEVEQADRTAVEHNGSVVEYVATVHTPSLSDAGWEESVIAAVRNRVGAEA